MLSIKSTHNRLLSRARNSAWTTAWACLMLSIPYGDIYRWMIELHRIEISTGLSIMSSHMALPHQGCLEADLCITSYLLLHHTSRFWDPTYPNIDSTQFPVCDWSEFYVDVDEPILPNFPEAKGKVVDLCKFVDSDPAGDQHTQRSCTGFLIYLNTTQL